MRRSTLQTADFFKQANLPVFVHKGNVQFFHFPRSEVNTVVDCALTCFVWSDSV